MAHPKTIIVEARTFPEVARRPEWNRWGAQGLQYTWDPRYYYFSDRSYGSGPGTENWLGNTYEGQPELGIELINADQGIRFLCLELRRGMREVLLCSHKGKKGQRSHWEVIVELLRTQMPDLSAELPQFDKRSKP